jgi:hypothetical protein
MALNQPFYRIARPFAKGNWICGSIAESYLVDPRYASDRREMLRAYFLLEHELMELFEYIEPSDNNKDCYSHRIYSLLVRASMEFEANCKAVLGANGYQKSQLNITDFFKIEKATRLSKYVLHLPFWAGKLKTFSPVEDWKNGHSLQWYQEYNLVKHSRHEEFQKANLQNALYAVGSVFCVLFAQFHILAFDPNHVVWFHSEDDGVFSHENAIFSVLPAAWPKSDDQYDFNWDRSKDPNSSYGAFPF